MLNRGSIRDTKCYAKKTPVRYNHAVHIQCLVAIEVMNISIPTWIIRRLNQDEVADDLELNASLKLQKPNKKEAAVSKFRAPIETQSSCRRRQLNSVLASEKSNSKHITSNEIHGFATSINKPPPIPTTQTTRKKTSELTRPKWLKTVQINANKNRISEFRNSNVVSDAAFYNQIASTWIYVAELLHWLVDRSAKAKQERSCCEWVRLELRNIDEFCEDSFRCHVRWCDPTCERTAPQMGLDESPVPLRVDLPMHAHSLTTSISLLDLAPKEMTSTLVFVSRYEVSRLICKSFPRYKCRVSCLSYFF